MNATLNELQRGFISLSKLANQDLPLKTGYWLGRIAKAAEAEMKTLEDARIKLVKRLGNEDAEGNYTIPADSMEAFSKEINELLEESIELPGERIKLDSLPDGVKLSAIDLINLDWLFEGEAGAEKAATAGA
jgi:hypothetical protein